MTLEHNPAASEYTPAFPPVPRSALATEATASACGAFAAWSDFVGLRMHRHAEALRHLSNCEEAGQPLAVLAKGWEQAMDDYRNAMKVSQDLSRAGFERCLDAARTDFVGPKAPILD